MKGWSLRFLQSMKKRRGSFSSRKERSETGAGVQLVRRRIGLDDELHTTQQRPICQMSLCFFV